MHSLFLTHWYPTESNPVYGTFIREHARAVSFYHKVTIIHIQGINQANPHISREEDGSLTVYRLRYPKPGVPKTAWISLLHGVQQIFKEISSNQDKPDIIHAHVYSSAPAAYFLSRIHNIPAILTEQASTYPRNLFTKKQIIANRFFLNRLKLIMPVSEALGSHIRRYGIKIPFVIVPNTVDTSTFHLHRSIETHPGKKIRLLTVAMLHSVKGINYLIEGISRLPNKEKIELMVVGDGPERNSLKQLVSDLKLHDIVHFLGLKNKSEVASLMNQAHIFVLTSIWDSLPTVLIEAMASGLPIVASNVGGIPEIVRSFCGRLVLPGEPDNIGEGINYVIDHLADFSPAAIAGYAEREFSLQAVGKKYSDVYHDILQEFQS